MGGAASVPAPPRPAPLPVAYGAMKLVLTKRYAPNQIVVAEASRLRAGHATAMHLAAPQGCAIVAKAPRPDTSSSS